MLSWDCNEKLLPGIECGKPYNTRSRDTQNYTSDMIMFDVPLRCENFVGRTAELGMLKKFALSSMSKQTPNIVLLHGMAGIGKSTLCSEFIHQIVPRANGIFLDSSCEFSFTRSLHRFSKLLRQKLDLAHPEDSLRYFVENSKHQSIIVLEDAATKIVTQSLLLKLQKIQKSRTLIVILSNGKSSELPKYQLVKIRGFSKTDAKALVIKYFPFANVEDDSIFGLLCEELKGLPILLDSALRISLLEGRYKYSKRKLFNKIQYSNFPSASTNQGLDSEKHENLSLGLWEVTTEVIFKHEDLSHCAWFILHILSFLRSSDVPIKVIKELKGQDSFYKGISPFKDNCKTAEGAERNNDSQMNLNLTLGALQLLDSLGITVTDMKSQTTSIHGFFQTILRRQILENKIESKIVLCLIQNINFNSEFLGLLLSPKNIIDFCLKKENICELGRSAMELLKSTWRRQHFVPEYTTTLDWLENLQTKIELCSVPQKSDITTLISAFIAEEQFYSGAEENAINTLEKLVQEQLTGVETKHGSTKKYVESSLEFFKGFFPTLSAKQEQPEKKLSRSTKLIIMGIPENKEESELIAEIIQKIASDTAGNYEYERFRGSSINPSPILVSLPSIKARNQAVKNSRILHNECRFLHVSVRKNFTKKEEQGFKNSLVPNKLSITESRNIRGAKRRHADFGQPSSKGSKKKEHGIN